MEVSAVYDAAEINKEPKVELKGLSKRLRATSFSLAPVKATFDTVRRKSFGCRSDYYETLHENDDQINNNVIISKHNHNSNHRDIIESLRNHNFKAIIENAESSTSLNEAAQVIIDVNDDDDENQEGVDKDEKSSKYNNNNQLNYNPNENKQVDNNNSNSNRDIIPLKKEIKPESPTKALRQLLLPFLVAGLGNVATGWMLDRVTKWNVFIQIPQLIILVPALVGLKGNVEMTLASRLSTHANLGELSEKKQRKEIIFGNMSLVQCQASTVGFLASLISLLLSYISPNNCKNHRLLDIHEIIFLCSSSVITANLANLILGTTMCFVIIMSHKFKINPDNIATPIAASLGDITTLVLLSYISHYLYLILHYPLIQCLLLTILLLLIPLWGYIARRVHYTRHLIFTGWIPIVTAMLLQNAGGLIMEKALQKFNKLAAFQPVINGVGGNLVAIHSSRMSTYLHKNAHHRELPITDAKICPFPMKTFFGNQSPHSPMARYLLAISGPTHLFLLIVIKLIRNHYIFTVSFVIIYLVSAVTQVAILLYLSYLLVHWTWKKGLDPDNNVIPFLTAFADFFGSALLAFAFVTLSFLDDPNAIIKDHC